jgi:hypothetical protein
LFVATQASAGLVVTEATESELVDTILGGGITVSNITFDGVSSAVGTFTGGISAGIGIESGILLTSGDIDNAVGPNTSDSTTTNNNLGGNALLDSLSSPTNDASVLTFDFVSDGGDLFFNYVFASEEYNEYVNSQFNDVFGFFVDGVNIATIPGSGDAVSINNVNLGSNSGFYVNNESAAFDIEYDGFTTVLTASILGLSAGTHSISLAIADVGDHSLDSGVFIEAGSFSDTPTVVSAPATLGLFGLAILGIASTRRRQA